MILRTAFWNTAAMSTPPSLENRFMGVQSMNHAFNECAQLILRLSDGDGSMIQKYKPDAAGDQIYVGSGQALLYKDDGTCVFNGRILSASRTGTVTTLTCEDWMSQLKTERIQYDFREDIDGDGLRVSTAHGEILSGTDAYRAPAYTNGANSYLIDNNSRTSAWGIDDWNGYYLIPDGKNFGDITTHTHPTKYTLGGAGTESVDSGDMDDLWVDDDNYMQITSGAGFTTFYLIPEFWVQAPIGSYVQSINSINVDLTFVVTAQNLINFYVGIYDFTNARYIELQTWTSIAQDDSRKVSFSVPPLSKDDVFDTDGKAKLYIAVQGDAVDTDVRLHYLSITTGYTTSGSDDYYEIQDTLRNPADSGATYNTLKVLTADIDLGVNGVGIWNEFRYSIVRELYHQINGIVTAGDPLVTLTTDVETTTGITVYHASDKSRFEILQYVAPIDKAVFWVPLGEKEVQWKNTTDSTATAIYDRDVLGWSQATYDIAQMRNQVIVYGARVGDHEVTATYDDATSQGEFGFTQNEIIRNNGVVSDSDALLLATALTDRDVAKTGKELPLVMTAELAGFSDIRLGDWLEIHSDILGVSGEDYIVDHWNYNGDNNTTTIRLQPKSSDGYIIFRSYADALRQLRRETDRSQFDKYVGNPKKDIW